MKWRMFAVFAGLVVVVLAAQDVPLASYLRRVETERALAGLERDAFVIAGTAEDQLTGEQPVGPDPGRVADLAATIAQYTGTSGGQVLIADRLGSVVVSTDGTPVGSTVGDVAGITTALVGTPSQGRTRMVSTGERGVFVTVPVLSGADVAGAVRIIYPSAGIDDAARERQRGLVVVFLISLTVALLAALLMSSLITAHLRRLQRSTERLAAGDFTVRADDDEGPAEIRGLAASFNAMTERIADLVERQRSFTGDASHQLRTPLTSLRVQLERARAEFEHDPVVALERLEAAVAETERLQRLVDALLMLARADGTAMTTESVDLSTAVHERVDIWTPLAEERNVRVHAHVPAGLWVRAVPDALEQIIDNVVDNALAVSPPAGSITFVAGQHDGIVELHVIDDGPGMSDEHLARAFDRFWRSPDATDDGCGIGLAVVRQLASVSGASVELHNRVERPGLVASVRFQAAPAPDSARSRVPANVNN
jgi:signal transduction histidine kinase